LDHENIGEVNRAGLDLYLNFMRQRVSKLDFIHLKDFDIIRERVTAHGPV